MGWFMRMLRSTFYVYLCLKISFHIMKLLFSEIRDERIRAQDYNHFLKLRSP